MIYTWVYAKGMYRGVCEPLYKVNTCSSIQISVCLLLFCSTICLFFVDSLCVFLWSFVSLSVSYVCVLVSVSACFFLFVGIWLPSSYLFFCLPFVLFFISQSFFCVSSLFSQCKLSFSLATVNSCIWRTTFWRVVFLCALTWYFLMHSWPIFQFLWQDLVISENGEWWRSSFSSSSSCSSSPGNFLSISASIYLHRSLCFEHFSFLLKPLACLTRIN